HRQIDVVDGRPVTLGGAFAAQPQFQRQASEKVAPYRCEVVTASAERADRVKGRRTGRSGDRLSAFADRRRTNQVVVGNLSVGSTDRSKLKVRRTGCSASLVVSTGHQFHGFKKPVKRSSITRLNSTDLYAFAMSF